MNPEEKRQFEDMKRQLQRMVEKFTYVEPIEYVDQKDVTDGDVTISTVIGGAGGTVNHLDFPDRWEVVRIKGKAFIRPLYNFTRL